jgi:hypothetical protein
MARVGHYELADQDFPDRIQRHRIEFPDVEILERIAADLTTAGFPESRTLRFVRQVCRWGGYYGIAERVRRDNESGVSQSFVCAWENLTRGDIVGALAEINRLKGLGRPSFASKFLRFLAPQSAPILDRIISNQTGFQLTTVGYGQLIQACHAAATQLTDVGVLNPVRSNGQWYIADIEAALYADMEKFEA